MQVLFVTTKAPWPPRDGGRVAALGTLAGLSGRGIAVTLVTPLSRSDGSAADLSAVLASLCRTVPVDEHPAAWPGAALGAGLHGRSAALRRFALPRVATTLQDVARRGAFDVVHAEQLQALPACFTAGLGLPIVLRAQNVESDLWHTLGARPGLAGWLARREAGRLAREEGAAVRRCAITLALSMRDATRLRALAGRDALVRHVAVPIETVLPPADTPLDGDPPIVLLGSVGWTPNRDAVSWFVGECWPAVRAGVPTARLHVIGERPASPLPEGATASPPIADSRAAFPNRAIFVVAARVTTGVRVKILEAWARGVPVVSTSAGASGLGAEPGGNLLIADDPPAFARAIGLLRDETLRATLVAGGRARLAADHDPQRIARQVEAAYEDAIARHAGLRSAELSASTRRA